MRWAKIALFVLLPFIIKCASSAKKEELLRLEQKRKAEEEARKAALEEEIKITISNGLEYYKNGQYEDAIRNFKKVIYELDPTREIAYKYLSDAYIRAGYLDSAKLVYSEGIKRFPDKGYLYRGLGLLYMREGEDSAAKFNLERAVELDTTDNVSYEALATLSIKLGKIDTAIIYSEHALCYDSLNLSLWTTIARCYEARKNFEGLLRSYKAIHRLKPDSIDLLIQLGKTYLSLDSFAQAEQVFKEYLSKRASDYQGPYFLGLTYLLSKRYNEAIQYFRQAVKMNPDFPKVYCEIGMAYKELKNYDKALEYADIALKKKKGYGYGYLLRGAVYEAKGFDRVKPDGTLTYEAKLQFEKAVAEYKNAVVDPEWKDQAVDKINYLKDYLPTEEEKRVKKFLEEGKQK